MNEIWQSLINIGLLAASVLFQSDWRGNLKSKQLLTHPRNVGLFANQKLSEHILLDKISVFVNASVHFSTHGFNQFPEYQIWTPL